MFGDVELNMAAMLDMAFQMLMFFILTFNVTRIESQVALSLPTAKPVTRFNDANAIPMTTAPGETILTVLGNDSGEIKDLAVGGTVVPDLETAKRKLDDLAKLERVTVQVDWKLRYEDLMQIVEACTEQKTGGEVPLSKLRFVELRPHSEGTLAR